MAYQIKKRSHIQETLELMGENGEVLHTIRVDIIPDQFRTRFYNAYSKVDAVNRLEGATDVEKVEKARAAVVGLLQIVFGEAQTQTILDYYEGAHNEALLDIIGFVSDVIEPQIEAAVSDEKERFEKLMQ